MRMWVTHGDVVHLHEIDEHLIPSEKPLCNEDSKPSQTAWMSTDHEIMVGKLLCPFCLMIGGPSANNESDRR